MLNDRPPERKPHPLERPPEPPAPETNAGASRRVTLHIPVVPPHVTRAIIIINVIIFIVRALNRDWDSALLVWGANQPYAVLQNGEAYRLVTSMFLHASIYSPFGGFAFANALHLIFNMFILYTEGTRAEQMFGHVRFTIIYLLGGLAGSVLSASFSQPPEIYALGASGAVFAVLAARIVFLFRHRRLFGTGGRAEFGRVTQLLVINLIFGLVTAFGPSVLGRVDNFAHFGGAIGGSVLAWLIGPFFLLRMTQDNPPHVSAEDVNPLRLHYRDLVLYTSALMAILIASRLLSGS